MLKRVAPKVCATVDTPKRKRVERIVLCMNSNKNHGGIHIDVPVNELPADFTIDGILIYYGPKK